MRRTVCAAVAGLAVLGAADRAAADEPVREDVFEPDVYPPPGMKTKLFFAGFGATAFWYGAAAGLSYLNPGAFGAEELRIPVAGPWMALADARNRNAPVFRSVFRGIFITLDGVAQAGGVLVMLEAPFLPTPRPVRAPAGEDRPTRSFDRPMPKIRALPVVTSDGAGFSLFGTF